MFTNCVAHSEEEAKKKIYNVSCERYFGFGCEIDEETSNKLEGWCLIFSWQEVGYFIAHSISIRILMFFVVLFVSCRFAWCSICSPRLLRWCWKQGLWRYVLLISYYRWPGISINCLCVMLECSHGLLLTYNVVVFWSLNT